MPVSGKPIPGARPTRLPSWPRRAVGGLVACMLAAGAAFVGLRLVTPSDGTQLPPRTGAWTGAGVVVSAQPQGALRDRDLVTAIDGVALGGAGRGWWAPAHQLADGLTYQVVRGGRPQQVSVVLRRAAVAGPLLQAWGTMLFVVVLFGVVAYLYARRAGPATSALLVLAGGLLASTPAAEIGVSAVDARGGLLLWLYLLDTLVVYVMGWSGLVVFMLLFPRPWPVLARRRWLLPVAAAAPPAVLVAWALAARGAGLTRWVGRVIAAESWIVMAVLAATIVLGVARYLTTTDLVGRQQLKWLTGGACLSATLALLLWFGPELVVGRDLLPAGWLGFSGLPVVAGLTVAVLRYRLFDLDRVVSRTVSYALLTVLLGGGYAGVVLGVGRLLGRGSSLLVAAATLAVAALFQPARRRVQQAVDQRFNRRRYDAAQTIQTFSARLRQQVDLDTLTSELLAVAEQAMQPTQVALWLGPSVAASHAEDPRRT
jgi:hypothetical protein